MTEQSSSASTTEGRLRQRVAAGELLVGTFLNTGSPLAAEICALAGFEWALVDLEHGAASEATLGAHLQALAGSGTAALVRVEDNERPRFARALDGGAEGVMVPRVGSAEDAERAVAFCRYPPAGQRGVATMNRSARFGSGGPEATDAANERVLVAAQIETQAGVEAVEEIAAVDGVDVLFVGPSDLTYALGAPGRLDDDRYRGAVDRILAAARSAGKAAGILVRTEDGLASACRQDFRFVGIGSDSAFLAEGARKAVAAAARQTLA